MIVPDYNASWIDIASYYEAGMVLEPGHPGQGPGWATEKPGWNFFTGFRTTRLTLDWQSVFTTPCWQCLRSCMDRLHMICDPSILPLALAHQVTPSYTTPLVLDLAQRVDTCAVFAFSHCWRVRCSLERFRSSFASAKRNEQDWFSDLSKIIQLRFRFK